MSKEKKIFNTGDTVEIQKIKDELRAKHLSGFIGKTGMIISWILYDGFRYKVRFNNQETHYFLEEEIELENVDN